MTYQVLARRRRPQSFADLVGQDHVTRTLTNALTHGRIAHAYLFTGARGVGKTSAARILAKCLNCDDGPTATPCNQCSACTDITAGVHVDVLEIDGASNTGVDNIRDLRDTVHYLPQAGRKKIYIIDEVHMLSQGAFNALLKTLEEPPEHVVFIFATTEPHKILPTIISRCQRFDFRRIPAPTIVANLRGIADEEQVTISEASLSLIAREAEGGLRDAQSLLERVLSFAEESDPAGARAISDQTVLDALGIGDRSWLYTASLAVLDKDGAAVIRTVAEASAKGLDPRRLVNELLRHYRNLAVARLVKTQEPTPLIDVPIDEYERLTEQAGRYSDADIQIAFGVLTRCAEELAPHRATSNPWLTLEMALLKATHARPALSMEDILDRLGNLETTLAGSGGGGSGAGPGPSHVGADASEPSLFNAAQHSDQRTRQTQTTASPQTDDPSPPSALELVRAENTQRRRLAEQAKAHPLARKLVEDLGGAVMEVRTGDDVPR